MASRPSPILLLILSLILLPTACTPSPFPTPMPTSSPQQDEEAIRALLQAEAQGVATRDMELLAQLWTEDAQVTDAKHTPDNPQDDTHWQGLDAVLDRYVTLVFPGNPTVAEHTELKITLEGDRAVVVSATRIGDEYAPAGDRWVLVRREGRWYIQSLVYNLEPAP